MGNEFKDFEMETPSLTLEPDLGEFEKKEEVLPKKQTQKEEVPVLTPEEQKMVNDFAAKIDIENTNQILQYGAGTQKKMADFSDTALENVKTQDLGEIGELISNVVGELKDFDVQEEGKFFGFFRKQTSKMENLKNKIGLNTMKLRGSYGSLGNQNVGAYAFSPQMKAEESKWILDGKKPLQVIMPGIVSSSLTWEQVRTINGGIDLGFLNNRLTAGFDYYVRYTEGMLTKGKSLPSVLGTSEPKENAADLKTRGWELSLAWRDQFNLADSPFSYGVRFIISDSRSFITKFDNYVWDTDKNGNKIRTSIWTNDNHYVGKELGEIWGLTTEGFFQNEEELTNHADQTKVGEDDMGYKFYVGDLKFKDINGDKEISNGKGTLADPGDFKKIGNSSIRLPYSIDMDANWKGFDLRIFLQGVGKRDWYAGGGNHYFWGIYAQPWTNVQKGNLDHWTPENRNAYFPRVKPYIAESTGSELACPQTKYLQDASYLRLKNVTFGYTLPKTWTSKVGIERVRFYFSGENLCELQHLKANLDPEALDSSSKTYPLQRSFTFGVNLNF